MVLGEKVPPMLDNSGFKQVRQLLEKVEEEFRTVKTENAHFKERL